MTTTKNHTLTEVHLVRAIQALKTICEIAHDKGKDYPERLGSMEMKAAITLSSLGYPEWEEKILGDLTAMIKSVCPVWSNCGDTGPASSSLTSPQGDKL